MIHLWLANKSTNLHHFEKFIYIHFRLSISENGCLQVLQHENSQQILSKIVQSLGVDEAGKISESSQQILSKISTPLVVDEACL